MSDAGERIATHVPADVSESTRVLIERSLRLITDEDVEGLEPVDLVDAVLAMEQLGIQRSASQPNIRIWRSSTSRDLLVGVITDDMPFLVDSVLAALGEAGRRIRLVMHPQLVVERDDTGVLQRVLDLDAGDARPSLALAESWMCVICERDVLWRDDDALRTSIARVLSDVRAAVEDWPRMREQAHRLAQALRQAPPAGVPRDDVDEAVALLDWLVDDHFTFLGYREYTLEGSGEQTQLRMDPDSGLGILRISTTQPSASPAFSALPPAVRARATDPVPLVLSKANTRSTVHRNAYLDYVGIKRFDDQGRVVGERRFLGLFAASAYQASVLDIPVVRRRVHAVMDELGLVPGSHSGRDLRQFLETYPRDELFAMHESDLRHVAASVLHLQERQQPRIFVRHDDYGRFVSCLVYLPRDRYSTAVRAQIADLLMSAFGGASSEYTVLVSDAPMARLHIVVRMPAGQPVPDVDVERLQERVTAIARTWLDDLTEAAVERLGDEGATALLREFDGASPQGYMAEFTPRYAVEHAQRISALADGDIDVQFVVDPADGARVVVTSVRTAISLSQILPILHALGAEVLAEHPFEVRRATGPSVFVLDFRLTLPADAVLDGLESRAADAFTIAWRGASDADGFTALVLRAGLTWQQVAVLRSYARYLRQLGLPFSQEYIQGALARNVDIASLLVQRFVAAFDPVVLDDRADVLERLDGRISAALDAVASRDEDRILRSLWTVICATLRTNAFVVDPVQRQALAMKIDTRSVPDAPLPRPRFEIWVTSPRVEGVHLRFGSVARGGLRWSDRREDFRTEILGLVKAQDVKNAVIVPVGAKGGFVPLRLPDPATDREAWLAEGRASYREFIGALLDVTDNLVEGRVQAPLGVVRRDGDDPYLVVAADKGTATFSDLANEIAIERGFWLQDAFASGGSAGYDHKAMGITARGAWESVKRHFRELGIDVARDPFTAVGIGDMSGDVFGNGMLLSRSMRLVAAFDHRHIVIDPEPDAERAYAERARLFALPRSSWADFDASVLSPGGAVYPRDAKQIELSDQARRVLGIQASGALSPEEVIRAVLMAPVDLLWNGGIGTYVKARSQSSLDVGDRANDAIRVNGADLRCRVVGEGGNLGFTQLGRVEAALQGVRLNTDAIDNSAGVDTSDHEVNIKILLRPLVETGALTSDDRVRLLAELTDDVASLVLDDNIEQNVLLGNARAGAATLFAVHRRMIRDLEHRGLLDRALEFLPDEAELDARAVAGRGLTSPELSVLLAYAKNSLTASLTADRLADDPWFATMVRRYFPPRLVDVAHHQLDGHPLRAEIIATATGNALINLGGITFVFRAMEETGASPVEVAKAAIVAIEVFDLQGMWQAITDLDLRVPTTTQDAMHLEVRRLLDRATRWLLQTRGGPLDVAEQIARFAPVVRDWATRVPDLLLGAEAERLASLRDRYVAEGVPAELATSVAAVLDVYSLLDATDLALRLDEDLQTLLPLYFAVSQRFDVDRTLMRISALPRADRWASQARQALRSDLYAVVAQLTARIARHSDAEREPADRITAWEQAHLPGIARARATLDDVDASDQVDLATLSVVMRAMRNLVAQDAVR